MTLALHTTNVECLMGYKHDWRHVARRIYLITPDISKPPYSDTDRLRDFASEYRTHISFNH
eukprot:3074574-Amphidinium_carterae.1